MDKNYKLRKAFLKKDDEFYTSMEMLENELLEECYKNVFRDKVVYCNCDTEWSNFYIFFKREFEWFGLKRLIATHFNPLGKSYMIVFERGLEEFKPLEGDGDFRSHECVELLNEIDIVVTNPPFSLFREYIELLIKYKKDFLTIGHEVALSYKTVFQGIKEGKILAVGTKVKYWFATPTRRDAKKINVCWFTSLKCVIKRKELQLIKEYSPAEYPKYDNYDAIEVKYLSNIPRDYYGVMGVPITYLSRHNTEQFNILGLSGVTGTGAEEIHLPSVNKSRKAFLNNKKLFRRVFIKRKTQ